MFSIKISTASGHVAPNMIAAKPENLPAKITSNPILNKIAEYGKYTYLTPNYPNWGNSMTLLQAVMRMVRERHYELGNLDVTVHADQPQLAPHIDLMRKELASLLKTSEDRVNIKAKTNEKMDAIGRGDAIAATAVVLLEKPED